MEDIGMVAIKRTLLCALVCSRFACFGAEAAQMVQPLDASYLLLDNAIVQDGRIVVAEHTLARATFDTSPGQITASGNEDAIRRLFDADYTTYWSPGKIQGAVEINLGQVEDIVAIEWDGYTYGETFPSAFSIYYQESDNDPLRVGPAGTLYGPSGERHLERAVIKGNAESHEVRYEFDRPIRAQYLTWQIDDTTDGHPARITRFEIMGKPTQAQGTAVAEFSPYRVSSWQEVEVTGEGIIAMQIRTTAGLEAAWSDWKTFEGSDLTFLNKTDTVAIQLKLELANTAETLASVSKIALQFEGVIMGPPETLVPVDASGVSKLSPTLLWRGGQNDAYEASPRFDVQVATSRDFGSDIVFQSSGHDDNMLELEGFNAAVGQEFFWRVRTHVSEEGDAGWSEASGFHIIAQPEPAANASSFGMNMGLDHRPWGEELALEAGFRWARLDFPWYKLETSPGMWDWARTDREISVARNLDISVLGILGYTPKFFSQEPDSKRPSSYPPVNITDWVAYVSAVATRYGDDVAAWEIWNEQNHRGFYSGTPREFAQLLKTAYVVIKNISPNSLVSYGGHAGFSPLYLDVVVDEVGPDYIDFINWHCYPGMPDTPYFKQFLRLTADYRNKLGEDKTLWLTEIGFPRQQEGSPSSKAIARGMVAHMASSLQQGADGSPVVDRLFHFQFVEGHGYGTTQRYAMLVDYPDDATQPNRLPEFDAYSNAVEVLTDAQWKSSESDDGIVAYRFTLPEGEEYPCLTILWAAYDATYPVRLELSAEGPVVVQDVFGFDTGYSGDPIALGSEDLLFVFSEVPPEVKRVGCGKGQENES